MVLNTEVTDDLRREGIAKDLIRTIQNQRKAIECEYTDRIRVEGGAILDSEDAKEATESSGELIAGETLADTLESDTIADVAPVETDYGQVFVTKATAKHEPTTDANHGFSQRRWTFKANLTSANDRGDLHLDFRCVISSSGGSPVLRLYARRESKLASSQKIPPGSGGLLRSDVPAMSDNGTALVVMAGF